MAKTRREKCEEALSAYLKCGSINKAAAHLGMSESGFRRRLKLADTLYGLHNYKQTVGTKVPDSYEENVKVTGGGNDCALTIRTKTIRTLEDALAEGHVNLDIWQVDRWVLNKWDMGAKLVQTISEGQTEQLAATEMWQVKVWFRRKDPVEKSLEGLLKRLETASPQVPKIKYKKPKKSEGQRALEISIVDPHMGLHCFPPGADIAYSIEDCEELFMWALESLLAAADQYMPVTEILFPFGNDFLHADHLFHTTTAGTPQPEMVAYHHTYERGELLAINAIDRLKQVAPVQVKQIPGNHDRGTSYSLGRVLRAWYRNDSNVSVDASSTPYKFWRFGCNLIGLEHGHSIAPIRLAALMANEQPESWALTHGGYREWHCGDQHRKGSSRPSAFEEQGVSIEFLPGLTAPNEWHRLKSFNWQKRGAMAWIYDADRGPVARLQVNINTWTGRPLGDKGKSPSRRAG